MKKTVCELFAGVGGFRLGLERQSNDWKTVWFSQWEPNKKNQWAHDCYVKHWGDIDEFTGIDIAEVNKQNIPDHTLLVGGFPCQDYSVAQPLSSSNGIEGKKGVLWWQIRDTIIAKKPPFVLLENVDRLLKSPAKQRGRDFGIILACLDELGYRVEWRVINAAEYGAAQKRRRIFIFAYHKTTTYAKNHDFFDNYDIIINNGFFAVTFPVENNAVIKQCKFSKKELFEISETFQFPFENTGYLIDGNIYTAKTTSINEPFIPLSKIIQSNVPNKYYVEDNIEKWRYLKGAKKIERTTKEGFKYTFSEGACPFPDYLDLPARTMLTSETSVSRTSHIIEDPQTHKLRILTPIEAERIQGFDDDWTNTGMPEKFRYFCMGNALVVPMITRMASTMGTIIDKEK